ncbi:MAG: hypothetical protein IIB00_08670, partial [candidate division Zixibacteria bacterium]|nr:hypothetical protein [candidate division Zixibacteria bacterium]
LAAGEDTLLGFTLTPPAGILPGEIDTVKISASSYTSGISAVSANIPQIIKIQRGDANWNGEINLADAIHIVFYIFADGAAPMPELLSGDPDCYGDVNIGDGIFIAKYLFQNGPAPCNEVDPL